MIRVYKLPPWVFLLGLLALVGLIILSLPIFLLLAGVFLVTSLLRNLLGFKKSPRSFRGYSSKQTSTYEDPNVSAPIHNKRIGTYRIKKSEDDPNVIEVVDSE